MFHVKHLHMADGAVKFGFERGMGGEAGATAAPGDPQRSPQWDTRMTAASFAARRSAPIGGWSREGRSEGPKW